MFSILRTLIIVIIIDMVSCKLCNSAPGLQCKFLIKFIYLFSTRQMGSVTQLIRACAGIAGLQVRFLPEDVHICKLGKCMN